MAGSTATRTLSRPNGTTLSVATADDEADVRALLRHSVIPGAVRVAFTREPNYFAGEGLAGASDVTIIARRAGALVAVGRCSVLTMFVNGQPQRVGYLGELRVTPSTQASPRLLRDGYAFLAECTEVLGVERFVTSIADDNDRARRVLEHGGRLGLPVYRPISRLVTLVAPVPRTRAVERQRPTSEDPAFIKERESELTEFLQRQGSRVQLGLPWNADRWDALQHHGVKATDFSVIRRQGRVVAAGAVWNQQSFRQTFVDGYGWWLRLSRPLINALQAARGLPTLPAPGQRLSVGALFSATAVNVDDWPALWQALRDLAADVSWLTVARDARDPELAMLRRLLKPREYRTTLFEVAIGTATPVRENWDGRLFRPEVGLL